MRIRIRECTRQPTKMPRSIREKKGNEMFTMNSVKNVWSTSCSYEEHHGQIVHDDNTIAAATTTANEICTCENQFPLSYERSKCTHASTLLYEQKVNWKNNKSNTITQQNRQNIVKYNSHSDHFERYTLSCCGTFSFSFVLFACAFFYSLSGCGWLGWLHFTFKSAISNEKVNRIKHKNLFHITYIYISLCQRFHLNMEM